MSSQIVSTSFPLLINNPLQLQPMTIQLRDYFQTLSKIAHMAYFGQYTLIVPRLEK